MTDTLRVDRIAWVREANRPGSPAPESAEIALRIAGRIATAGLAFVGSSPASSRGIDSKEGAR